MFIKKFKIIHYKKLFLYGIYNTFMTLALLSAIVDFAIASKEDAIIDLLFVILAYIAYKYFFKRGKTIQAAIAIFWIAVLVEFLLLELHSVDFNIIFSFFIPIIAYISMPKRFIFINLSLFYALLIAYLAHHYNIDKNNIFLHNKSYLIIYIMAHFFILSFGIFYNLAIEESIRRLQESNRTKELLLNEVHHRVKNNLNLVASILGLNAQATNNKQTQEFLQTNQKRIESMAILHEILYKQDNANSADLSKYVNKLAAHILRTIARKDVTIKCDIEHLQLPMDSMIQFGIILNELLTNSIKHKEKNKELKIDILFKRCKTYYCLGYCDNSTFKDINRLKQGFGYNLIMLASKHFNAKVSVDASHGLCYKIMLKKGWQEV